MATDAQKRGRRLRQYVTEQWSGKRGITGVADRSGINRDTLYAWFKGEGEPSLSLLQQLADALGVTRSEVVAAIDGQLPPPNWRQELGEAMEDFVASLVESGAIEWRAIPPASRGGGRSAPARRRKSA